MHDHKIAWRNKQRGMSKWGWLIVVGLAALAGSAVLRIGPHYIDFRIVQATVARLSVTEVHKMPRSKINEHFAKQLRVENFTLKVRDILTIERDREKTLINIFYEVREPLMYNADIVLTFSEQHTYR